MSIKRDYRSPEAARYRRLYKRKEWKALRADHLQRHPLCCRCERRGMVVAATVANHKIPHKGDESLFFDRNNLESTCKTCHDGPIQSEERRGYSSEIGGDGWPVDPKHPSNQ